ncbi:PD-(D/E)XK nuclease-like domain-containing protein [Thermopirellula anaerolimosa]
MTVADSFLIRESAEVYQAKASEYLTSHQLADFRRCPVLYRKKRLGLIEDEDRPAYLVGRALHTLVLEGRDAFEEQYAVGGPINPKTGEFYGSSTKAFAEWAAEQGKPVLTVQQHDLVQRMGEGVRGHGLARDLLSEGTPEGVVRAEYCQMPCQIRMDWFDPHRGIVDLKTCDDLDWFEADARRYGYVHQVAFYQAVLSQAISLYQPIFFIAVEKREPFRCGVWQVHQDILNLAQRENEAAIERLRRCMASDTWGTGYESLRLFDAI